MKAVLKFNLPDEKIDHLWAIRGGDYRSILTDIANEFRAKWKHESSSECNWDIVYTMLWDIFKDNNFDPWSEDS